MTICTITGTLKDNTGTTQPNTLVEFHRPGVFGQDGATIIPKVVQATSDANGTITVSLFTGNYTAKILLIPFSESFTLAVPDAPTAVLFDLINAAPTVITADEVIAAQAARDAAQTAAGNANANATQTAQDRIQTVSDAAATYGDRIKTGLDAAATAADRLQTTQDKIDAAASAAAAALAAGYGPIIKNDNILAGNLTLPPGFNGMSVGPIEISAGVILTISDGSVWAVI
ncbi:MAG: hypothetical protein JKX71_12865 [Amylibacter sp.]|nr:hypothetical protein [Amylibacter sp.]